MSSGPIRAVVASAIVVAALATSPSGAEFVAPARGESPAPAVPAPSDVFRYDRCAVTVKDGKETLGKPEPAVFHGYEFRDDGQWLPLYAYREDLPRILAMRRLPEGARTWRFAFHDVAETAADGRFVSTTLPDGVTKVEGTWTLASRGKAEEPWAIREGTATTVLTLDAKGVVQNARVSLAYKLHRAEPKKGDAPKVTDEVWNFALRDVKPARYPAFVDDVNSAIDRGVAFLRTKQKGDGTFDPHGDWTAGTTALSLYTLLSCGVPRDDPAVAKGLAWLVTQDVRRTYELALGIMAVERAYVEPGNAVSEAKAGADVPPALRAWCQKAASRLESQAPSPGSFGYPNAGNELYKMDSSNTQYGALGLRAAARLGIAVEEATWAGLIRYFRQCRDKDAPRGQVTLIGEREGRTAASAATIAPTAVKQMAGFRYRPADSRTWGSMTCAAIGSLSIARDELRRGRSKRLTGADDAEIDEMIAGAWGWLDRNWATDRHPAHPGNEWRLYWLYSLERAGLLTGVRLVNGKDWYFDGAMDLITEQKEDSGWTEGTGERTTGTCFALLFLKRATAPTAAVTGK